MDRLTEKEGQRTGQSRAFGGEQTPEDVTTPFLVTLWKPDQRRAWKHDATQRVGCHGSSNIAEGLFSGIEQTVLLHLAPERAPADTETLRCPCAVTLASLEHFGDGGLFDLFQ